MALTSSGYGSLSTEDLRWWAARDPQPSISAVVQGIQDRQSYRRALNLHHLRLYADRQVSGMSAGNYASTGGSAAMDRRPRLSLNVVRNCIDTAMAQITKSRPRPQFMTAGGDWDLQQRAKKRGKFVEAVFHRNEAYTLGQRCFKNGCIFGTGLTKVTREHGRIRLENTFPNEILVDDVEGIYGEPQSMFQVRSFDKLVLRELFPGKAAEIERANPPDARYFGRSHAAERVLVIEAWHLPSGPDADDGCHCVVVDGEGGALAKNDYKHSRFPFATFRWAEDPLGWHGTGLAHELTGIQYEINQLVRNIQLNMYTGGNLKVLVEKGSKVTAAHLSNDLRGIIVEYVGMPPQWIANDVISPQILGHLQWLIQQAYNLTGVSMSAATAMTPTHAESGRAKLVQKQSESQRFLHVERQYERYFMDLSELVLDAAGDIYEDDGDFTETYPGKAWLEQIGYSDVLLENEDDAQIQIFPTSILPETPAGKLAMVESLEARGYIDRAQSLKLLDFPDIDSEMSLELAPVELIDERIQRIVDEGVYLGPTPRMDLELALRRSVLAYQRAELRGIPDDRLDLLNQFIDACAEQQAMAQPPAPVVDPAAADMGAMDPAMAAAPEQVPLPPGDMVLPGA